MLKFKTFLHILSVLRIGVWGVADVIISIVLGGFLSYGYWNRKDPYWMPLYREDGIFEWATFYLLIVSAIFFFVAAYLSFRNNSVGGKYHWWYLFFSFSALLIAGEEISWGQRLFNWHAPVWLSEINLQNETNVHNLVKIGKWYPYISVCLVLLLTGAKWWLEPKNTELFRRLFPPRITVAPGGLYFYLDCVFTSG